MKALRTHAVGGPDTLTLDEVDVPVPGKGQVLVDVKACAINFPDTLMIRDLYQFKPERPFAPGHRVTSPRCVRMTARISCARASSSGSGVRCASPATLIAPEGTAGEARNSGNAMQLMPSSLSWSSSA